MRHIYYSLMVLSLSLIIQNVQAAQTMLDSSAPILRQNNARVPIQALPNLSNLNIIDVDTDDINQLNRKLQIEKAQAELKKIKNDGRTTNNGNTHTPNENAQTTVTGVAINQDSKRIAWLQFADGGSLTVNIGSKVGKYTVSDISMTGVTLSVVTGSKHKKVKNVYLKRAYAAANFEKKSALSNNGSNPFFIPSPVLTGANSMNNENVMVPPIIQTK